MTPPPAPGPAARELIVNCDDLGLSPTVNAGVLESIEAGIAGSCSLMPPCPAAGQAVRLLREHPAVPVGVHLTLVRDSPAHRWGPLAPASQVPSLLDSRGRLFLAADADRLLAQAHLEDVEREIQAQLRAVLDQGLTPTHLDWHCLADGGRPDIADLTLDLAREHGLAARVWLPDHQARARERGLRVIDHDFLDSFRLPVGGRADAYVRLLRDLPPGVSEWAVHPGLRPADPGAADADWPVRAADHAFLTSPPAHEVLRAEGITVIDHREFQRRPPGGGTRRPG